MFNVQRSSTSINVHIHNKRTHPLTYTSIMGHIHNKINKCFCSRDEVSLGCKLICSQLNRRLRKFDASLFYQQERSSKE